MEQVRCQTQFLHLNLSEMYLLIVYFSKFPVQTLISQTNDIVWCKNLSYLFFLEDFADQEFLEGHVEHVPVNDNFAYGCLHKSMSTNTYLLLLEDFDEHEFLEGCEADVPVSDNRACIHIPAPP
jgi:hypothetical protein